MSDNQGWTPGDPIRVLPYGKSKVGKTFGAGTFPRPCIMDFDRGVSTLFNQDFIQVYGYKPILYKSFFEPKANFVGPIVSKHEAYDQACLFFDAMMAPTARDKFDTWVIDSGTTLSDLAMNKAVILLGTKEYGFLSKTHDQAMKHKLLMPKIQDWGAERSLVEQFVDMVLSTDKHVVFICHEYEELDSNGFITSVTPLLTGKSRQAVPLKFDEVYHVRARRKGMAWERVCRTQADGIHLVGSRNGVPDDTPWSFADIRQRLVDSYEARVKLINAAQTAATQVAGKATANAAN